MPINERERIEQQLRSLEGQPFNRINAMRINRLNARLEQLEDCSTFFPSYFTDEYQYQQWEDIRRLLEEPVMPSWTMPQQPEEPRQQVQFRPIGPEDYSGELTGSRFFETVYGPGYVTQYKKQQKVNWTKYSVTLTTVR